MSNIKQVIEAINSICSGHDLYIPMHFSSLSRPLPDEGIVHDLIDARPLRAVCANHALQQLKEIHVSREIVPVILQDEVVQVLDELFLAGNELADLVLIVYVVASAEDWLVDVGTKFHRVLVQH